MRIFKILDSQYLLRDSLNSYDYSFWVGDKVHEDEEGKYKIKYVSKEVPCNCHPETCCHFDGKVTRKYEEKVYL